MQHSRTRRFGVIGSVLALLASLLVALVTAPAASADTIQSNGCLGVTGTLSTFPIPITGAFPGTQVTLGDQVTLTGSSVTIGVSDALVGVGVVTGLAQAAPSLAAVGTPGGANGTLQGQNAVSVAVGDVSLNLKGTNTVEEQQTTSNADPLAFTFWAVQDAISGVVTVYSGTPDPANGNTNLTPTSLIPVIVPLADTTWTADNNDGSDVNGDVIMSVGENPLVPSTLITPIGGPDQAAAPLIIKSKINGTISVNFFCWPGTASATGTALEPGASSAISSLEVLVPPLAPECDNITTTAPAAQSIEIDLNAVCSDPNGNIDPATWTVSAPSAGGLAPIGGQPGKYTYTAPATDPGPPVTFTFEVSDALDRGEGPFTSAPATASITILGNLCNATTGSCPLRQIITTPVFGATKTLEQAGSSITMIDAASIAGADGIPGTGDDTLATAAPIVLNGNPQLAVGNLNELTVTNARGDDAGWSVLGQVSSFLDVLRYPDRTAAGVPACLASDATTWDNHCIPGDNLGWTPSSAVDHTVVPGDVASSTGGGPLFPPGFFTNTTATGGVTGSPTGLATSAQTLCSAPSTQSGGTFTCNAGLGLAIPASAAAGAYVAVLTLTLS